MKKLVSLLSLGLFLCACGDDGNGTNVSVKPDAKPKADGGPDAGPADAGVRVGGTVPNFAACKNISECVDPEAECVPTWYFQNEKSCLPKCKDTSECPVDSYCFESTSAMFVAMKDHCAWSLCGEQLDPANHSIGVTGGACELGGESALPKEKRLPGWCNPVNDGVLGVCQEVGTQKPGEECDPDRARGGNVCDATGTCLTAQGALVGTCGKFCDPKTILTRATGDNSGCGTGEDCQDASYAFLRKNAMGGDDPVRVTLGVCIKDVTACRTVGATDCPKDAMNRDQGCLPTNPLRATGLCSQYATGSLAADATCPALTPDTPDDQQCVAGTVCGGSMKCETMCDIAHLGEMGAALVTCATGKSCKSIDWPGGDGTADDTKSLDWGICQ